MPTYRIEVDVERDRRLREIATRDHRPVLWQVEKLLTEAIDRRHAEASRLPEPSQ